MKNNFTNKEIYERITRLEVKVEEIVKNHLPHLEGKVDRIGWLLVTTLISIIIGLILLMFKAI